MKVYASISGGKDSLAALITHMEHGGQCDGAIYCRIMFDDETSAEVPEPWTKDIISYRCFAPGRCKGRVVGVKRFDPYIPAWCPKLKKNGGMKQ